MPDDLTALATAILWVRRSRADVLPSEMFGGEQAWDLLLVLFVADAQGRRLTGDSAVQESAGFAATGRRWIQYLTKEELIVGDGEGNLSDTLTLTPRGLQALEFWLGNSVLVLTS